MNDAWPTAEPWKTEVNILRKSNTTPLTYIVSDLERNCGSSRTLHPEYQEKKFLITQTHSINQLINQSTNQYPLSSQHCYSSFVILHNVNDFNVRHQPRYNSSAASASDECSSIAAAQPIYSSSRFDHITPLLHQLHWLKAKEQIDFKLAVLVLKCVHGPALPNLANELSRPAASQARCRLHSASSSILVVCQTCLMTVGDRSFPVAASHVWNNLTTRSLWVFKNRMKTH